MLDSYLVPAGTVVIAKGDSEAIEVLGALLPIFLVTLRISEIVEQEAIDVSLFGSADNAVWDPKPLLNFPQKFYPGETPILLDLSQRPDVKFVRAHWEVNRWGRGPEEPRFVIEVRIREVPAEMLAEAQKIAENR